MRYVTTLALCLAMPFAALADPLPSWNPMGAEGYGIPPWQVIGSEGATTYEVTGDAPVLRKDGGVAFVDDIRPLRRTSEMTSQGSRPC